MEEADIGVVGLGVMGLNLARNLERSGLTVAGYDLDMTRLRLFLENRPAGEHRSGQMLAADSPAALAAMLRRPRRILMLVPAGGPVDGAILQLKGYLEAGDILIDGGNSYFLDTERRAQALMTEGLHLVGMGVSGGARGALIGPSLMPGGPREAWDVLAPWLEGIAARAADGQPCVGYIGPGGAGHYVKMVHNGIEYGDMQLIAEAYDLLHRGLGFSDEALSEVFARWNEGELQSYLIEVTAAILAVKDPQTGRPILDVILDQAEQKGTGGWMAVNALDIGAPTPTISAAVESRFLSSLKGERVEASQQLAGPQPGSSAWQGDRQVILNQVRDALYASRVVTYGQGMDLMGKASGDYRYDLDCAEIARIWRAGCIIRARLLEGIMDAYRSSPDLPNLMLSPSFREQLTRRQDAWRAVIRAAVEIGIPVPAMSASLAYYDGYRSARLPANLIQAQRDFFGAHTYRRVDTPGVYHTQWEPNE
jgi:6-phosphogluconate dehydrogenase